MTAKFVDRSRANDHYGYWPDIQQFRDAWNTSDYCDPSDAVNQVPVLRSDYRGGDVRR